MNFQYFEKRVVIETLNLGAKHSQSWVSAVVCHRHLMSEVGSKTCGELILDSVIKEQKSLFSSQEVHTIREGMYVSRLSMLLCMYQQLTINELGSDKKE